MKKALTILLITLASTIAAYADALGVELPYYVVGWMNLRTDKKYQPINEAGTVTILLSGESPDQTLTVTVYKSDGSIIEQKNTPLVFTSNQENCRFSNSIPEGDEDYYEEYLTLHCHKGLTGWLKFCQPKDEDYVELYYATMYYTCLIILPSDTWPAISSLVTQFATPK